MLKVDYINFANKSNISGTSDLSTEANKIIIGSTEINNPAIDDFELQSNNKSYKEISNDIKSAILKSDISKINSVLNYINSSNIDWVFYEYKQTNDSYLTHSINMSNLSDSEKKQILNKLKTLAPKNGVAANDILANDLLQTLNSDNKEKINDLLNNQLTVDNVYNVNNKYVALSKQESELAATEIEKKKLKWGVTRGVKERANRPETIYQGILNNQVLSLEEKKEYLHIVTNKYIEYARKKGVSEDKINEFINYSNQQIENCTFNESPTILNAVRLEDGLKNKLTIYFK